jgi:hypothetical protein
MTPVSIRILAFAAVASLPLLAQQPTPGPQPPAGSSPQAVPAPNANSPEVSTPQLQPVAAELENKLDTKDAKTGDSVVVKTTQATTIGNGMEIPKGSEIKGHIVDVASKSAGGDNSRLTIQFDQAQLKDGQSVPIRSVIQSVAPAGTTTEAGAAAGPSATTPSSGGVSAGGGAGAPSTASGANPSQPAAGGQPALSGTAPAPGTVVATRGNLAIKTTSIPGVLLIGDVNGRPFSNASGALLGAKQDVHLDGGTLMVVAIMSAPPTVGTAR